MCPLSQNLSNRCSERCDNRKPVRRVLPPEGDARELAANVRNGSKADIRPYRDPNPVSIVRTVRNTIRISSQGEKYLM